MRQDPSMPRAVAEYNVEQMRRFKAQTPMPPILEYPTIPSLDSLRALAPLDLAATWLRGHDYREQYREDVQRMRCVDSLALVTPPSEVLGVVQASDSTAYVLYTEPGWQVSKEIPYADRPLVAHLRRGAAGWRILLNVELLRPVETFRRLAACPSR